jgi:surfactin synthase thioesterase subunit
MFSAENLVHLTEPKSPAARLICFPHAGAGAVTFRPWIKQVHDEIELIAVRLPGREKLFDQAPTDDLISISKSIGNLISKDTATAPVGLFGYCSGAFLAFETARCVIADQAPPVLLAVCSQLAPHENASDSPVHDLPAAQLRDFLRAIGGTDPRVIEHEEFWSMAEPAIRADYRAAETYSTGPEPKVTCDVVAFRGSEDDKVPAELMAAWADVTTANFSAYSLDGGHFLLQTKANEVLAEVQRHLLEHALRS